MYNEITNTHQLTAMLDCIKQHGIVAIDTEYIPHRGFKSQLCGISFCFDDYNAYFLPITSHMTYDMLTNLDKFFYDSSIKKIFHNAKADLQCLWSNGIKDINNVYFDTQVASWVINPLKRKYGLKALVFEQFTHTMRNLTEWFKSGRTFLDFYNENHQNAVDYACEDAFYTWKLYKLYNPKITETFNEIFHKIEMPIIPILAKMEMKGKHIDRGALTSLKDRFQIEVDNLEAELQRIGTPIIRQPVEQVSRRRSI
jgi:DNA polymerase-1